MQHLVQRLVSVLILAAGAAVASGAAAAAPQSAPEPPPPAHVDDKLPLPASARVGALRAALAAQRAEPERPAPQHVPGGYLAGIPGREPIVCEPGDGSLLVLGNTYRMAFDADGATFVPFFGSQAPSQPVRLSVRSLRSDAGEVAFERSAAPVRAGRRVVFERGPLTEVYDVGYESVEQSFLVRERVGAGALVIELDVESELARASDGAGLLLAGELGGVRYSAAVAIDARGERVHAPTRWRDGRIEIEVPAAELARLCFPLLVDPVLSVFSIQTPGNGVLITSTPDVAHDESGRTWCIVHERQFSASHFDVHVMLMRDGSPLYTSYAMTTSVSGSTQPRVANNRAAAQFLVVAAVDPGGLRRIRAQTFTNLSGTDDPFYGPTAAPFYVSASNFDALNPDVGGDASLATPGYYCVTWQRVQAADDHDILVQMVRTDSTLFGSTIYLSNSDGTVDSAPSIASSNGTSRSLIQNWTIAWQRSASFLSYDLYAGRIRWDGVVSNSPFALDTSASNTRFPSVSSPTSDLSPFHLVAYMRGSVGSTRTWAYVLQGVNVRGHADLTGLTGAPAAENHLYPNVDCDGRAFVLVETETFPSSTLYGMYASTLTWLAGQLAVSEGHVSLGVSGSSAPLPRVACAGASGGVPRRSFIGWHYENIGPIPYVYGGYYDAGSFASFCHPGLGGVPACPCGNAPSGPGSGCDNSSQTGGGRLTATGAVDPDSVTLVASALKPSTVCVFAQAFANDAAATPFGDGVQCVGGTVRRLAAKPASGGTASFPAAGDPSISARSAALGDTILPGTARRYFAFYRDQNAGWACSELFNVTNALQVQW